MAHVPPHDEVPVHDIVGVGFGPSNLALAIALTEQAGTTGPDEAKRPVSAVFLERQQSFGWHRGMLLDDATMQVSFLKDLVTLRNPTSRFSFLAYLHAKGRLVDFINHKTLYPLRIEYHDYLEWAAAQVDDLVRYGHEVIGVRPVTTEDGIELVDVLVDTGEGTTVHRARNLVLATGLTPRLPAGVIADDRIWHSRDLLFNLARRTGPAPSRFVVVGAGQSAAEVTAHLHERFPDAEVCAVFSRYGYSPADDSSFANRIFDPGAVDDYFDAPADVKTQLMDYHGNTNYSVVDGDLIAELYRRSYREQVLGQSRLRLLNTSRLRSAVSHADGVQVTIETLITGQPAVLDADVLICATGYDPVDPATMLGELSRYCHRDELGRLRLDRDYRVSTGDQLRCGIYLQGGTEHSHGISSSLLSNGSVRAAEILESIVAHRDLPSSVPAYPAGALRA
ncbi:lysine N(6)-hydroxylase/L-ornithine N(5)-oxygenase family protein [Micromonospora sp. NBC_01796]|uniref:lysine N(6)-hydroxylase/L-ornithine N(5)-oxygenase family protein n=1 Tax=Micromonospora sp. NBC_01796 TaxID=2975987 RepID=UPI002DD95A14|nr:lysine N(6)-hydroxylase/L-ornithine N(5)-oxygenase family protein [Micromonospora sp. NBC_01796]WSA84857.1 lysine N(6)-hydroxylase/L-ornithine N(5)-oxygenase family protein [Micromonospora sp. NBC_01796]